MFVAANTICPQLGVNQRRSTHLTNSSMAQQQQTRPVEVPVALGQLIAVNAEFEVLMCLNPKCRKGVNPAGAVEHLRKIHKEKPGIRHRDPMGV